MPFTRAQFFDVFAAYNAAFWPAAVILWVMSVALVVRLVRAARPLGASVALLLALHWLWAGIAYHLVFFADINPAARWFAVLFVIQAVLLFWHGVVRRSVRFEWHRSLRHVVAAGVLVYALIYPIVVSATGHRYPAMPTFGVPCPTTILTIGFLLSMEAPRRWWVAVIPLLWAAVGSSGAVLFDVRADVGLLVAGIALVGDLTLRRFHAATVRHAH